MADKFAPNNRNKLESEDRKRLFSSLHTLIKLGYQADDAMADIGCGIGLFTFPAAEIGGGNTKTSFGPPLNHRLSRNHVLGILADAGLHNATDMDIS